MSRNSLKNRVDAILVVYKKWKEQVRQIYKKKSKIKVCKKNLI